MSATQSKYTITAGQTHVTPAERSMTRTIIDGVTTLEKTIAAMRREQDALYAQLEVQREWLETNRDHELYEQRQAIHRDRWQQWDEIEKKVSGLLDDQQARIDTLEGRDREEAVWRLMHWTEAPFLLLIGVVLVVMIRALLGWGVIA